MAPVSWFQPPSGQIRGEVRGCRAKPQRDAVAGHRGRQVEAGRALRGICAGSAHGRTRPSHPLHTDTPRSAPGRAARPSPAPVGCCHRLSPAAQPLPAHGTAPAAAIGRPSAQAPPPRGRIEGGGGLAAAGRRRLRQRGAERSRAGECGPAPGPSAPQRPLAPRPRRPLPVASRPRAVTRRAGPGDIAAASGGVVTPLPPCCPGGTAGAGGAPAPPAGLRRRPFLPGSSGERLEPRRQPAFAVVTAELRHRAGGPARPRVALPRCPPHQPGRLACLSRRSSPLPCLCLPCPSAAGPASRG